MSNNFNPTNSESFLWGVSTSGYQHEGGYNGNNQPCNNWALWERQHRVEKTGAAAEFWSRYETDFQTCREAGLNAFRLSIEWARVQPTFELLPGKIPEFDWQALDDYSDRLAACRDRGLEPLVTLHHFTHPAWLGIDAWLNSETIEAYLNYAIATVTHLNRRLVDVDRQPPLHWFITINEPNILVTNTYLKGDFPAKTWGIPAALKAYNNLLCAHIRAYNAIHDLYERENWTKPKVTFNTYCSDLYWSEKVIWDLLNSRQKGITPAEIEDYIYDRANDWEKTLEGTNLPFNRNLAYRVGRLLEGSVNWLGRRCFKPSAVADIITTLNNSPRDRVFDFLALDYYDPFFAHSLRLPSFADIESRLDLRGWLMSSISSKWWDWRCLPEGLFFFCKTYAEAFKQPILIAENGMALRRSSDNRISAVRYDGLKRSEFLQAHIAQVKRLKQEGINLLGYFHWSLTDNYEWGSYTPRFGLLGIDFTENRQRQAIDLLGDCPLDTYGALIRDRV
jgi:beta-glucosidase/6-phospho-beta-glucosidase/beta-galactosidase